MLAKANGLISEADARYTSSHYCLRPPYLKPSYHPLLTLLALNLAILTFFSNFAPYDLFLIAPLFFNKLNCLQDFVPVSA